MRGFWSALAFLTRIPIPARLLHSDGWRSSPVFYPAVGGVIGLCLAGFNWLTEPWLPPWIRTVLVVGVWVRLTGGLHLDGLMDTADGMGANRDREQTLTIMKDSRVGAMGVLAALFVILVKMAAVHDMGLSAAAALFSAPVAGRMAILSAIYFWPYVRQDGVGSQLKAALTGWQVAGAYAFGIILLAVADGWLAMLPLTITLVVTVWMARRVIRRIGGLTGDVYGAIVEVTEATVLVAFCVWR
ncbi:adenosylcobinamide-GDP ribazoletransferase [Polycladomyces abyssicola]|uniref:Adenosylcobinamide-GDP ribazoletransferase n=1 Tax=Polycladomyces abyssicola TaxID=1125966 RepID=A0A8D5UG19_9BACL|nr:adenosylcobinamide-GDP ribazoletransferase [Polycladomyces abyssicola]BCU82722.1 adenosylcobinamide-GDP ribazoletransferase [Polycladomyces abyssicola]